MMKEIEFNLLDEKWILVRKSDCTVDELSLTDALLKSHEYVELAGELPTQNVSILRLMLAVLHTVFSRYSPQGEPSPLYDSDDAADRWKELWNAGRLPEKPIRDYLASVHDRFWLFHPERPFYQTEAAKIGTEYTASKLNGAVSESGNKIRLFCGCTGVQKSELSYSEAARWLLHINNYDDAAAKPKGDNLPSPGVGWLGKLGLITIRGNNLFETLVYNLILLNHRRNFSEAWGPECPAWEPDVPNTAERAEIPMPDNLSELYTLQSRRLWLDRDNSGKVVSFRDLSGDFFPEEDAFIEPMTVWNGKKAKNGTMHYNPKVHDNTTQMWREFSSCFYVEKGKAGRRPGVVQWVDYLRGHGFIDRTRTISFETCSAKYDAKKAMYEDIFFDSLTFHTDLLTEIGEHWRAKITKEIEKCKKSAEALRDLARDIELAAGSSKDTVLKRAVVERACEQYYYEIDLPFRNWLEGIDPNWGADSEQEEQALREWHETAKRIALRIGQELVESAGTAAIVGRAIKDKKKYYSAPDAYRYFKVKLKEIYPRRRTMTEKEIRITDFRKFMWQKIERLKDLPENKLRAELAKLRHGIGHAPGEIPAIWGAFLTDLPEEFYRNDDGNASPGEWAVYTALTMFALHQQGHDFESEWMNEEGLQFGASVRKLAKKDEGKGEDEDKLKRIRARFNKIATASDLPELNHHLRGVINLLSGNGIKLDYADLAVDLYNYSYAEGRTKVRLKWGQDFCRQIKNDEN